MQQVSDAYRQEMERPVLGAAKLAVTLSVVDEDAAPGAEDKSEHQAYWSSVESALAQDGAQKRSYATFEPGRWKADGTLRIADEPGGALLTEGYVSENLSGADGRFAAPPVLALEFESPVSVPALSFRFDQVAEEWCTALTVTAWKGEVQLVQRQVGETALLLAGFAGTAVVVELAAEIAQCVGQQDTHGAQTDDAHLETAQLSRPALI